MKKNPTKTPKGSYPYTIFDQIKLEPGEMSRDAFSFFTCPIVNGQKNRHETNMTRSGMLGIYHKKFKVYRNRILFNHGILQEDIKQLTTSCYYKLWVGCIVVIDWQIDLCDIVPDTNAIAIPSPTFEIDQQEAFQAAIYFKKPFAPVIYGPGLLLRTEMYGYISPSL